MTAEQVKAKMAEKGISQNTLSRMSGVAQATISAWLRGKIVPSEETRTKIANALAGGLPDPSPEEEAAAAIMDALKADVEEEPEGPLQGFVPFVPGAEAGAEEAPAIRHCAPVSRPGPDWNDLEDGDRQEEDRGGASPPLPQNNRGGYSILLLELARDEHITIEDDLGAVITIHMDALSETDRTVTERICWAQLGLRNGAINRKMYERIIERIEKREA